MKSREFNTKRQDMSTLGNINIIFYLAAYLVGSIPFGYLICRVFYGIDIREFGSKSIGATNVYRYLKSIGDKNAKKISICVILLDASKGCFMVIAGMLAGVDYATLWAIALLAIIGHCYPVYLNFQGGKGVATTIGAVLPLIPIASALALVVWFVVGKVFKLSSLASLIGVLSGIVLSFYIYPDIPHVPVVLIGIIIFYQHIPNIKRLILKQEDKVEIEKKPS